MAHVHDRPVIVERDSGGGAGLGMVLGIILAVALFAGMLWFLLAGTMLRPATPAPATDPPAVNVNPPDIQVPDTITIQPANPPQQQQPGDGSGSNGN